MKRRSKDRRPELVRPEFARVKRPLKIVVEGIGDVIKNYYDPAFRAVTDRLRGEREFDVTFADKSEFWRHDPHLSEKMHGIMGSVGSWGGKYLDKSDPAGLAQYQSLEPD